MTFVDSLKYNFKQSNTLIKLIYINVAVFLIIQITVVFSFLITGNSATSSKFFYNWFAVPAMPLNLIIKPWTLFTYMFLHINFWHILWNMIMLYFSGQLFIEFLGERKLLFIYIVGGLCGALFYILAFNIFPVFKNYLSDAVALGASASIMAIIVSIATYIPDFRVLLFFIFPVKLKYIALALFIIDFFSIPNSNPGGHIAHIGGALFGLIFTLQLQKGNDISLLFNKIFYSFPIFFKKKKKTKLKTVWKNKHRSKKESVNQEDIDAILDKISRSGYESLTKEEKEILFKASKKQ